MQPYIDDIEKLTKENTYFRNVIFTAPHSQLVLMSIKPGEDIGFEVHEVDQFFRIEQGRGEVTIEGQKYEVQDGYAVVVPAGSEHNVTNTSSESDLKLYTIYSPPQHPDRTIHKTKQEGIEQGD